MIDTVWGPDIVIIRIISLPEIKGVISLRMWRVCLSLNVLFILSGFLSKFLSLFYISSLSHVCVRKAVRLISRVLLRNT